MSLQVEVILRNGEPIPTWAKFSDEILSRDLDWNLTSVTDDPSFLVLNPSGEEFDVTGAQRWSYDVGPTMLVDDLVEILTWIRDSFPADVTLRWSPSHIEEETDLGTLVRSYANRVERAVPVPSNWEEIPYWKTLT